MRPVVTIIITAFKCENYIAAAIESALAQGTDCEIVVVEDCGPDGTYEIARRYSGAQVRVVRNDRNLGQHSTKNRGLRLAAGKFIKFLDGDDLLEPGATATLTSLLMAAPEATGAVYARSRRIDQSGRLTGFSPHWGAEGYASGREVLRLVTDLKGSGSRFGNVSPHLFKKTALEAVRGFPESNPIAGDWETFLKLLAVSDAVFTEHITASYRQQPLSLSASVPVLPSVLDDFGCVRRLRDFFADIPDLDPKFYRDQFYRDWAVRYSGRFIVPQFLRWMVGRQNHFADLGTFYREQGLSTDFKRLLLSEVLWYSWRTLTGKIRSRLKMPRHPPLFKPSAMQFAKF
jgi:glycosyltransferase involved in cell wall biosynthesis